MIFSYPNILKTKKDIDVRFFLIHDLTPLGATVTTDDMNMDADVMAKWVFLTAINDQAAKFLLSVLPSQWIGRYTCFPRILRKLNFTKKNWFFCFASTHNHDM